MHGSPSLNCFHSKIYEVDDLFLLFTIAVFVSENSIYIVLPKNSLITDFLS